MKRIKPNHIKMALQAEVKNIQPSSDIWDSIEASFASSQKKTCSKRYIYKATLVIMIFVLSSSSLVLANSSFGKQAVDRVFKKFGIHLAAKTPQLTEKLRKEGAEAILQGMPLENAMDKIPGSMKLPTYLPQGFAKAKASFYKFGAGSSIRWSVNYEQYVQLWYHYKAFGEGSKTITIGEPSNIQEVKIGELSGMAFHDDNGWNLSWAMDGSQYTILTNISLEEAVKIASSMR